MKTRKQNSKKEKKPWLLGVIIIVILISSTLGYFASRTPEEEIINYKGHEIYQTPQGWALALKEATILLTYNPLELENITVTSFPTLNELNAAQKIYLSLDPNQNLYNGLRDFSQLKITPSIMPACYEDLEGCQDRPLKDCTDATPSSKIILIKTGVNETNINYNSNCLTVEGKGPIEITKALDKLLLQMLGV